jgi:hypothetical protein
MGRCNMSGHIVLCDIGHNEAFFSLTFNGEAHAKLGVVCLDHLYSCEPVEVLNQELHGRRCWARQGVH